MVSYCVAWHDRRWHGTLCTALIYAIVQLPFHCAVKYLDCTTQHHIRPPHFAPHPTSLFHASFKLLAIVSCNQACPPNGGLHVGALFCSGPKRSTDLLHILQALFTPDRLTRRIETGFFPQLEWWSAAANHNQAGFDQSTWFS